MEASTVLCKIKALLRQQFLQPKGQWFPTRRAARGKWKNIGDELFDQEVPIVALIRGSVSGGLSEGPSNMRLGEASWR